MRRVTWTDRRGWKHVSLVRDNDPDEAGQTGVPVGPPDLDRLDCEEVKRDLNNMLVEMGILTYRDIQRLNTAVSTAVRSVLTTRVVNLYKEMEGAKDE